MEKPFLYVDDKDISTFIPNHITYQTEVYGESRKYDDKITFLGTTGLIASLGNIYGHNVLYIDASVYKQYLNIPTNSIDYNTIYFLNDGSGIITRGKLYVNSQYWIEVVDTLPEILKDNTVYLLKEN